MRTAVGTMARDIFQVGYEVSIAQYESARKKTRFPRKREPDGLISLSGPLCERCNAIDLGAMFGFGDAPYSRGTRMVMGSLDSWTADCDLCRRFISHATVAAHEARGSSSDSRNENTQWILESVSAMDLVPKGYSNTSTEKPGLEVVFCPESPIDSDAHSESTFRILPVQSGHIAESEQTSRILNALPDFGFISSWLTECEQNHHCCVEAERTEVLVDRLIDCQTQRLVKFNNEAFVALSYVWGTKTPVTQAEDETVRRTMCLPEQPPQTISDAIETTVRVGHRYLWVDRYCVDQYHSEQKLAQINAMADVYEQAVLTIVVLYGDASDGIPGISAARDGGQIVFEMEEGKFASTFPLDAAIEASPHNRRAWTFQESLLSKRSLLFTKSQVYFKCRSHCFSESMSLPYELKRDDRTAGSFPSPINDSRMRELRARVTSYGLRTMTYDSDALNAFRGLLARSGFSTYYGHPVHPITYDDRASNDWFLASLMWGNFFTAIDGGDSDSLSRDISRQSRRAGMPTWSWASSKFPVTCLGSFGMIGACGSPPCTYHHESFVFEDRGVKHEIHDWALTLKHGILPEVSPKLIFQDAMIIKAIDLDNNHLDSLKEKQHFSWNCHEGCQTKNGTDILLLNPEQDEQRMFLYSDLGARRDLELLALGEGDLNAVVLGAHGGKTASVSGAGSYRLLLVCQPPGEPAKRVGTAYLFLKKGTRLNPKVLVCETTELV